MNMTMTEDLRGELVKTVGYALDSGVTVFDTPDSMALGYLGKAETSAGDGLAFPEKLVAEIKEHLGNGCREFVIDLSRLNYIDSAGVGIVVGCRNLVVQAGEQIRVVTPQDRVHWYFRSPQDKLRPATRSQPLFRSLGARPAIVIHQIDRAIERLPANPSRHT